jgi:hypothetical protein
LVGSTIVFALSLQGAITAESQTFGIDDTITIDVDDEQRFYLLYDGFFSASSADVQVETIYSRIRLDDGTFFGDDITMFARVKNLDTNDYVYLDAFGPNTSITINDSQALGTYTLQAGEHEIQIVASSPDAADLAESFSFTLVPTSFLRDIFLSVFGGIATITFLVLFFVSLSMRSKRLESQSEHPTYIETPKSVQDLYELDDDDFFSKYDKK